MFEVRRRTALVALTLSRLVPFPTTPPTLCPRTFAYTSTATAFFIVNTLMPVVRPENFRAAHAGSQLPGGGGRAAAAQKNYFVLFAGALQFALLWWLSGSARG